MSIIVNVGNAEYADLRLTPEEAKKAPKSLYQPSENERKVRTMILKQFTLGYNNMYKPRKEFNDMSLIDRMSVDQMAFNTYQPNNGDSPTGDQVNDWRSNAIRPVVRNKCISIAAHATAQLIFPKIFAFDRFSNTQEESAVIMRDLMEWAADQSDYEYTSLKAVISAIINPASIGYTEYGDVYRNVKKEKGEDGRWIVEKVKDEEYCGFHDYIVPCDEIFIENFYEHDIQKQGWLIWRRVLSYNAAQTIYGDKNNWKYVKPGMQVIYNDPDMAFYDVYDTNMRQDMVEEVRYWNKNMDLELVLVNGVLLSEYDEPNKRQDKQYPFFKFGYELIDEGQFFYYKSLCFKMQSDANIINTLYPMIIDGTYLSMMPPMINVGSETIGSDVIVPGAVTTLADPNSNLQAIQVSQNLKAGLDAMFRVDESINESSQEPLQQGQAVGGDTTAYEIQRMEANANTVLGLFVRMISQFVKQYGKLRLSDILQYLTVLEADQITDNPELVYKTFLVKGHGKHPYKKVEFSDDMPDEPIDSDEKLSRSYSILEEEDRLEMEIAKVNPRLFRDYKYQLVITPDILQPRSETLEREMNLSLFDRAIQLPNVDQDKVTRDFLFGSYKDIKDPDEYIKSAASDPMAAMMQQAQQSPFAAGGNTPGQANPQMKGPQPVKGVPNRNAMIQG